MEALKRCPSCGGEAKLKEWKSDRVKLFRVECGVCGFKTGNRITAALAASSWNKRYASKFALPVGSDGKEIDLGAIVKDARTGEAGQVASITFAMSGHISVIVGTTDRIFEATPDRLASGALEVSAMLNLEDDMRLTPADYCAEILERDEAADWLPLAAVEMKLRDVKKRLKEIGGL